MQLTPDVKMSAGPSPFSFDSTTRPEDMANYLKQLRQALDAGQIDVNTFVKQGRDLATEAYKRTHQIAGGGSSAANSVKWITGALADAGFQDQTAANKAVNIKLPETYQEQVRDSLLPSNITGEQREKLLKDIPNDIEIGSDQYNLEREGLRQKIQQETVAGEQKTKRAALLNDLTSLLNTNVKNQFDRSVSDIAEGANTAGIFRSTGFGNALAKQQAQLSQDAANTLGQKAIEYGETDINAIGDILSNVQGFQTAGQGRQFSLDDFTRQANMARELAAAATPQPKGKTSGEKWAQGVQVGAPIIQGAVKAGMGGK